MNPLYYEVIGPQSLCPSVQNNKASSYLLNFNCISKRNAVESGLALNSEVEEMVADSPNDITQNSELGKAHVKHTARKYFTFEGSFKNSDDSTDVSEEEEGSLKSPQSTKETSTEGQCVQPSIIHTAELEKTWNEKDCEELLELAIRNRNDWKKIAKKILLTKGIRVSPKTLRCFHSRLISSKQATRTKFTHNDDLNIIKYFLEYGMDWKKISDHFSDKNPVMIKNRFYSYIKKKGLVDKYIQELAQRHEENMTLNNEDFDIMISKRIRIIHEDQEEIPLLNSTFLEMISVRPEDELQTKISEHTSQRSNFQLI